MPKDQDSRRPVDVLVKEREQESRQMQDFRRGVEEAATRNDQPTTDKTVSSSRHTPEDQSRGRSYQSFGVSSKHKPRDLSSHRVAPALVSSKGGGQEDGSSRFFISTSDLNSSSGPSRDRSVAPPKAMSELSSFSPTEALSTNQWGGDKEEKNRKLNERISRNIGEMMSPVTFYTNALSDLDTRLSDLENRHLVLLGSYARSHLSKIRHYLEKKEQEGSLDLQLIEEKFGEVIVSIWDILVQYKESLELREEASECQKIQEDTDGLKKAYKKLNSFLYEGYEEDLDDIKLIFQKLSDKTEQSEKPSSKRFSTLNIAVNKISITLNRIITDHSIEESTSFYKEVYRPIEKIEGILEEIRNKGKKPAKSLDTSLNKIADSKNNDTNLRLDNILPNQSIMTESSSGLSTTSGSGASLTSDSNSSSSAVIAQSSRPNTRGSDTSQSQEEHTFTDTDRSNLSSAPSSPPENQDAAANSENDVSDTDTVTPQGPVADTISRKSRRYEEEKRKRWSSGSERPPRQRRRAADPQNKINGEFDRSEAQPSRREILRDKWKTFKHLLQDSEAESSKREPLLEKLKIFKALLQDIFWLQPIKALALMETYLNISKRGKFSDKNDFLAEGISELWDIKNSTNNLSAVRGRSLRPRNSIAQRRARSVPTASENTQGADSSVISSALVNRQDSVTGVLKHHIGTTGITKTQRFAKNNTLREIERYERRPSLSVAGSSQASESNFSQQGPESKVSYQSAATYPPRSEKHDIRDDQSSSSASTVKGYRQEKGKGPARNEHDGRLPSSTNRESSITPSDSASMVQPDNASKTRRGRYGTRREVRDDVGLVYKLSVEPSFWGKLAGQGVQTLTVKTGEDPNGDTLRNLLRNFSQERSGSIVDSIGRTKGAANEKISQLRR